MPAKTESMNPSLDLLEKHNAHEQARLLQRFRELRQWQQRQQQELMQQQHQQLKTWQQEQSKVQMLIESHRGTQWSQGPKSGVGGPKSPVLTVPNVFSDSADGCHHNNQLSLSQSLGAGFSVDSGLAVSMQDTLKSQNSLPKPIMYIDPQKCLDPADEDKYTTSDLFSNPGCFEDQLDIVREDEKKPSPARDWKSDSSDSFMPLKLPPPRPLKGRRSDEGMDRMAGLEELLSNVPASFLQQVLNMLPESSVRETHARYTEEVEQSASPTLLKPGQQPKARKLQFTTSQFPHEPSVSQTTAPTTGQQLSQQLKTGGIDSSQGTSELQHHSGQRMEQEVSLTVHSVKEDYQAEVWDTNSGSDDSFDEDIEEGEDGSGDDDDVQNQTAKQVVPPDDRPIQGIGGRKSFQQLLEEQLQTSQTKDENHLMPKVTRRQPFLRKGEGISRFKSAPKKNLRKPLKKSEQRPSAPQINGSNLESAKFKTSLQSVGNNVPTSKTHQSATSISADKTVPELRSQNSTDKKTIDQPRLDTDLTYQRVKHDFLMPGVNERDKTDNSTADRDTAELDSLAEFELLEDAVDNMSFRSNSSLVQKLVRNDKQGQWEVFQRLRQMSQSHSLASDNLPEQHFRDLKSMYKGERSSQVQDTGPTGDLNKVTETFFSAGVMKNNNSNNNNGHNNNKYNSSNDNNNRSVFVEPDTALDSSATLTDSSDEDNQINEYAHQQSGQPIQNRNGFSSSSTQLSSSPTKVMPRKVVPISSRFSSEKPLTMLQSLSQQADFLSGLSAPVCFQPDVKHSVKESSSSFAHGFQNGSDVKPAQSTNSNLARFHSSHAVNGSMCNNIRTTDSVLSGDVVQTDKPVLECGGQDMSHPSLSAARLLAEYSGHNYSQLHKTESAFRPQIVADKVSSINKEPTDESDSDTEIDNDSDGYRRQLSTITDTADDDVKLKTVERKLQALSAERYDDESSWTEGDTSGDDEEHEDVKHNAPKKSSVTEKMSTPPTSRLMSQLFPKLQQPKMNSNRDIQQAGQTVQPAIDGVQSRLLREKLMALDVEIERFRSENANLEILRKERENGLAKLKQEIENFQREKEQELVRLEQFKKDELKKLRQEKKLFDNYQKNIRSIPDKKEREEIEALTNQFQDLQDELKKKESRWNSSTVRMKKKIAELEAENAELKEEIRLLEKKRLEWMSAQNSVKTQNSQRVWPGENGNTKSSSKGQGHVRSSTPTKNIDRVKAPSSSSGTSEHLSSDMNGKTRSGRASTEIGLTQGGLPPEPTDRGGTVASSSKAAAAAAANYLQAPAHTRATSSDQPRSTTPHSRLSAESQPNQSVPVMIESSLPVASQESSLPGSLTSLATGNRKSAAMVAQEKAVIEKGDEFTEVKHPDGKVEKTFKSGAKEIHFPNGTVKEIASDGQTIVCHLANGDVRQIFPDHRVVYIFAEAEIMQTTFPDGLETFHFKNGQIERRYPDGTVEITFPSKDVKYLFPDGGQEVILTDGTVMQYNNKGERTVEYPSGDREVHTAHFQRREFPDGIVKTVYSDGRHETRFPNGRVRLRDKAGNVIMDQIVYR